MANFEPAIEFVMNHEDASCKGTITYDAGGMTRWGIASRYNPGVDIENLTLDQAKVIYEKNYWTPYNLNQVNSQDVASVIMDCLVNPGQGFASIIQGLLRVTPDGNFGRLTISAINLVQPMALISDIAKARMAYYNKHDAGKVWLGGLLARAVDVPAETSLASQEV